MVVHTDDIARERIDRGPLRGIRRRLGRAAGAVRTGLSRYELAPGERAMPVHVHADEEELFVVLRGAGLSWQDGRTFAVGPGDCIVHRAGEEAHTILAAGGPDAPGLDVLAWGSGSDTGLTWLPRAGAFWAGPHWLPHDGPDPFAAEAAAGELELPSAPAAGRPPTIVATDEVEPEDFVAPGGRGDVRARVRDLGTAAGSVRGGVQHYDVLPGRLSGPPHCHSIEEELFVVLDGDGALLLGEAEHDVRAVSVVARPPATGVPHAFRAGPRGLRMLAFGPRADGDLTYFPRSGKVGLRGLGVRFAVRPVDYWDGET